jgi:ketosteroid isomerase-like protein
MRRTGLLITLLCATALFALAQEDDDPGVQSRIVALEKAWNQAYKAGDKRALDTILDKDIVLINDDGTVQTKAEFLAGITKAVSSQEQQVAPESMSVHVFGNVAIASGVFRAKGTEAGKSYVRRERFVDTWLYRGGKWVCVATNATPVLH